MYREALTSYIAPEHIEEQQHMKPMIIKIILTKPATDTLIILPILEEFSQEVKLSLLLFMVFWKSTICSK